MTCLSFHLLRFFFAIMEMSASTSTGIPNPSLGPLSSLRAAALSNLKAKQCTLAVPAALTSPRSPPPADLFQLDYGNFPLAGVQSPPALQWEPFPTMPVCQLPVNTETLPPFFRIGPENVRPGLSGMSSYDMP